ncbi:PAS/PAC sensor signal transduction histidine kinase [Geoanaerobacter pelophilus]|uniref:histidine kinase n=1 Tax=Geoanaerobacter pelophilus TaxID=60036 RepID=A0ABQ0MLA8_9BACT|nr:PAS domain-containing sensor histidine kinase [Geoanaerobacter pelophilus]GAW67871.1 PAS/PAC sensor signal transduction histidine kinase [Geoanaerobacter pelophilus]
MVPTPTQEERTEQYLRRGAVLSGIVAAVIGAVHLALWLSGLLTSSGLYSFVMKTNASLCLALSGFALAVAAAERTRPWRWWSAVLAAPATAIAALTLAEHLLDVDFGIDQFVAYEEPGALGVLHPNRMGPPGAFAFTICGIGTFLLLQGKGVAIRMAQSLGLILCLLGLMGLLGYLYHVEGFYAAPRVTAIAWPTSFSIFLLGVGLLLARPREAFTAVFTSPTPGGFVSRALLLPAVALPILLGWLVLAGEFHGLYGTTFSISLLVLSWIVTFSAIVYEIGKRADLHVRLVEDQRTREALLQSEEKLRDIIDNMAEGLIVIDAETAGLYWNRRALEMYDFEEELDAIKTFERMVQKIELRTLEGELLPLEQWPIRRVMRGEELHDVELLVKNKEQTWQRIYSYRGAAIRDPKGKLQMGVLTLRDITVKRHAQEALRESEEKFRAVFEQAAVGMGRVTFGDARWIDVNEAFCNMLGYSREEMLATPWPEMTHPDDLDLDLIPFRNMAAGELDSYSVEKRFLHKAGRHVWARLTLSLVRDLRGGPDFEVAIVEDITRRKEAEEALRRAKDELELRVRERTAELEQAYVALQRETDQRLAAVEDLREKEQLLMRQSRLAAMGEMLGNIAHQWRQPLNVLGLLVQQMQLTYEVGNFSGEFLKGEVAKVMDLIRHMSDTITDFKDFLKEEKEPQPFNVNAAVVATVTLLEAPLKAMRVEVRIEQTDELVVTGHRNEFSHVIMNLVNNAREALNERAVATPQISIRLFKDAGRSVVTVTDNAGGIAEEIMPRMFEPYFTTKGPDKGTGIGLYMSKNIIEKSMGGRLYVRNTGEGAEFRIEFSG